MLIFYKLQKSNTICLKRNRYLTFDYRIHKNVYYYYMKKIKIDLC